MAVRGFFRGRSAASIFSCDIPLEDFLVRTSKMLQIQRVNMSSEIGKSHVLTFEAEFQNHLVSLQWLLNVH